MRLKKLRIRGFQSFSDSGDIAFEDGFNLIIGQNNSGKSALLRALLPALADDRHRTPENWQDFKLPQPEAHLMIEVAGGELRDGMLRIGGTHNFPVSPHWQRDFRPIVAAYIDGDMHVFNVVARPGLSFSSTYPSHALFKREQGETAFSARIQAVDGMLSIQSGRPQEQTDSLPSAVGRVWNEQMFYFAAERMTVGECGAAHAVRLQSNAANLPSVLNTLRNERGNIFDRLVEHLEEIFPTVGNLSVTLKPDSNFFEIRVWPTPAMERVELSFPLNSSGTGVAQVIAILAAIMTIDDAVIVIDEINSFLHPAAVKTLLRILQTEYPHHQYIISTHAPEVIGFSNPQKVHLVKRDGYESTVEELDLRDISALREVADHLGVSMSDVFAAERIIWVEGPTEELIFPYVYQLFADEPLPRGIIVTSVAATGDFNRKRDREIVYEVYRRLSSAATPLVAAAQFSFDTETLSDADKAQMENEAGGGLHFLPRRHIECYLVDPQAIAGLIHEKDPEGSKDITSEVVAAKLAQLAGEAEFVMSEWGGDIADEAWLAKVDAAKLIDRAMATLSEHRATFNKKEESLKLIQLIASNNSERLQPLFEYVERLVKCVEAA